MVVAHVVGGGGGVSEPMVAGRGEDGKRGGTAGTGVGVRWLNGAKGAKGVNGIRSSVCRKQLFFLQSIP